MDEALKGCCITCGYLSRLACFTDQQTGYQGGDTPTYLESPPHVRKRGGFYRVLMPGKGMVECTPACLLGIAALAEEVEQQRSDQSDNAAATLRVLNQRRECPHWAQYQPGIAPKEQLAVSMFQRWEESRREWEKRLEDDRREWEAALERSRREWESNREADRLTEERRFNKLAGRIGLIGVALAVIGIVSAIAAITPDSLLGSLLLDPSQSPVSPADALRSSTPESP